jgi:hypothetical protein
MDHLHEALNTITDTDDADGILEVAAGAVGTPSMSTTGDLNTGFWFPAADTVALSTAGVERMRVTSGGLVGIGKTPTTPLDVYHNTADAVDVLQVVNDHASATGHSINIDHDNSTGSAININGENGPDFIRDTGTGNNHTAARFYGTAVGNGANWSILLRLTGLTCYHIFYVASNTTTNDTQAGYVMAVSNSIAGTDGITEQHTVNNGAAVSISWSWVSNAIRVTNSDGNTVSISMWITVVNDQ